MFSEYASRFLAQSQSRIAFRPDEAHRNGNDHLTRPQGNSRFLSSRSYLQRTMGDPYQQATSQISNFAFPSRTPARPAPLFYSATDEFREEDDEAEHEREIADLYALQRSRRHLGASHLQDSSEIDSDEASSANFDGQRSACGDRLSWGKGIRSSWRGGKASRGSYHPKEGSTIPEKNAIESEHRASPASHNKTAGHLVDVGLEDTLRSDLANNMRGSYPDFGDDNPPSVQRFRDDLPTRKSRFSIDPFFLPTETDKQTLLDNPRPLSSTGSSPTSLPPTRLDPPLHDAFWGHIFLISLAGLFATAFLVYLHTSTPSGDKSRWGDTVYMTVHKSFFLLGIYTLVSVIVSLIWLSLLRFYVRPLVYVIIVAVPVLLYSFSLYPFISSFDGSWNGASVQDKVMRFGSAVPFLMSCAWTYNVIRGRHAIGKAVSILEFACRILAANPELLILGLGILVCVVSWTWVWMLMFTRVFLGGHLSGSSFFVIHLSSWWLGTYFVVIYLWSLGVIAGIQRAVTAATVSQWYFHRFATPAPTSSQIVQAAVVHAVTTLFGTICLSRLLALLIRLPLLLLPSRISSILSFFAYSFVPTPVTALTNPLALTYAAIHSQPLSVSARGLAQMTVLSPSADTASLHPRSFSRPPGSPTSLHSYQVSKLILHATRFMMSLALGFGGWVTTARSLNTPGISGTTHGSLYAYIVGLIAGTIGWSVLGAMEGVIADIVDASIICWGSEAGTYGREARYCREAGWLFGQDFNSAPRHSEYQAGV